MAGNRLFFPVQAVLFYSGSDWDAKVKDDGADAPIGRTAFGVQDVNITSNFSLTPTFQLGQAAIYENVEGVPEVEITLSKVLDGRPLLWHLATQDAKEPTLISRTAVWSTFQLGLWPDHLERCFWNGTDNTVGDNNQFEAQPGTESATPIGVITCPKAYPSSLGYTINTTEGATENLTLSGNEKVWARAGGMSGANRVDEGDWRFQALADLSGLDGSADSRPVDRIIQGYNVILDGDPGTDTDANGATRNPMISVFPHEIPGINEFGMNPVGVGVDTSEMYEDPQFARIQSVSFSVSLTRNDINALGFRLPVFKSVQMPIQVSTEITVVSVTDDGIAVEAFSKSCADISSLRSGTIRIVMCNKEVTDTDNMENGVIIYTGTQNKLTSVAFGQGGTGGGNVQATYSYQTNNEFTVLAAADPAMGQVDGDGDPVPPVFGSSGTTGTNVIITPGGWWENKAAWVTDAA